MTVEKKSCARSGSPSSTARVRSGNKVITWCATTTKGTRQGIETNKIGGGSKVVAKGVGS